MSEKIKAQHLGRKAVLYIRQSSAYQVTHNLESQKLQKVGDVRQSHDRLLLGLTGSLNE